MTDRIKNTARKSAKAVILSMLMVTFMALTNSCTRHHGDIGDFFGEWKLNKITADGEELLLYPDNDVAYPILYTRAFQAQIIRINSLFEHHGVLDCYGTWKEEDGYLELRFTYSDTQEGTDYRYNPPAIMHFSPDGVTRLKIDHLDGKKMEVSYIGEDGVKYAYYLTHPH